MAGVALGGYLVYLLRGMLTPLVAAMLLAYLLDPVVDRLERWHIPRGMAITVLLGALLLVLTVVLLLVLPMAIREAVDFFKHLPHRVDVTWQKMEPWLVAQGITIPSSFAELRGQLGDHVGDLSHRIVSSAGGVATYVANSTVSAVNAIVTLILIPILAFYFLYDFDRMRSAIVDLIPWSYRPLVLEITTDIDQVVAQFIRGQLVVMGLLAVAYSVGYSIVGVPLAVAIGMLAGAVSFIPHVGGAVALGTALLACILTGATWLNLGLVVVVHLAIQWTEGFVVTPRIMAGQVGLPAVWVILALLGFGELFGFLGVVIAVPAAAVIKTLLVRAIRAYKESEHYGSAPTDHDRDLVPALDPESIAAANRLPRSVPAPPLELGRLPSATSDEGLPPDTSMEPPRGGDSGVDEVPPRSEH